MKNARYFFVGLTAFICLQACTERTICPAYQSAFIHDDEVRERYFSYFKEDSTPKIASVNKDRFLIIEPMSYQEKLRSFRTIPMKDVYPQDEDSLAFDDEIPLSDRQVGYDSTAVISEDTVATRADSVYMISLKKEKFNIDQELYLWYLRDYLVYPDVRLQLEEEAEASGAGEEKSKKKKGFFGFFKNLFKGKKNRSDTTGVETSATEVEEEEKKKKGGIFGFLKKNKNKESEPEEAEENNEEGTEEEEDEDF
ncbi:MAG: hypothetical protein R3345_04910 [Fulvivirga sp.]|nr:hypothetical protein [Fulvivirga sp.]